MPPEFGIRASVEFAGIPPHMSSQDFVLWTRLRRQGGLPFTALYFDVAVGEGAQGISDVEENVAEAWRRITRQRIDVVGERVDGWTIIEVRAAAGAGAIGTLTVYRDLWRADPPDGRPTEFWLVTDVFSENLIPSLDALPARLVLV